jgi:hypothetical protein
VLRLACEGLGDDPGGHRRGFLEVVRAARPLLEARAPAATN